MRVDGNTVGKKKGIVDTHMRDQKTCVGKETTFL